MKIINPIYDRAFKYLFQDLESAQLLIELILGSKINHFEPINQEYFKSLEESYEEEVKEDYEKSSDLISEFRLDFVCFIEREDGAERVLIVEIQRKNQESNIERFRTYLASQYQSDFRGLKGKAVEICSIYFLEKGDAGLRKYPAVHVQRKYVDMATDKEILNVKSDFVEKLSHEVFVINLKAIEKNHRTLLEQVLQIFNQKNMRSNIVLEVDETTYPKSFTQLLERLNLDNVRQSVRMLIEAEAKAEMDVANRLANLEKQVLLEAEKTRKAQKEAAQAQKETEQARIEAKLMQEQAQKETEQARVEAKLMQEQAQKETEQARIEAKLAQEQAQKETEQARIEAKLAQINAIKLGLKYGANAKDLAKDLKISLRSVNAIIKSLDKDAE